MHEKAEHLLQEVKRLNAKRASAKDVNKLIETWRTSNNDITDFTRAEVVSLQLEGVHFSGIDFSDAIFRGCNLTGANFRGATLKNATFESCQLRKSHFERAKAEGARFSGDTREAIFTEAHLQWATFDGSSLRGATFAHATLDGASFRNVKVNTATNFKSLVSCDGCSVDRYVLASLGEAKGGLTTGNLMDMDVVDDTARLRTRFGGVWSWLHLASLVVFIAPYVWFAAMRWATSQYGLAQTEHSITVLEALARYVVSGGRSWRSGWDFQFIPTVIFLAVFTYNVVRAVLLWKTKSLETQELVSGLPARFSIGEPVVVRFIGKVAVWRWLDRVNLWGFWLMLLLVAINTVNFLLMRVPVDA